MDHQYKVGNYLVDRLFQLGLEHLFSIAGDYSIEWLNRFVEPSKIKIIEEVNELNAGYAADAYARFKGLGALCTTYSAGSLCAANPIAGAYVEKVPIVLINGTPSIQKTLTFEQTGFSAHHFISGRETDLQVFQYITVAAVRIDKPDLAPMLIDYALTQCITERRPVYIELLEDIVDLSCAPAPSTPLQRARTLSDPKALTDAVSTIVKALKNAKRPVAWIGVEIDRHGLQAKAEALLGRLRIPYVTELMSKAVLAEDDRLFAGVFDGKSSSDAVQDLMKGSDFVLALGVWLTDINSLGWPADHDKTAFASWDTVKFGTYFGSQVALEHLVDRLLAAPSLPEAKALPERLIQASPSAELQGQITYQGFYDFIPKYIDEHTIVGADASMNYFGCLELKVPAAGGFFVKSCYSAIGYIGPAAPGVCLAKGKGSRVMAFSGDGGFQMSAQCLSTQTRFGLNPIVFVIDNGVYGVEQWLADASVFHGTNPKPFYKSCLLHPWEYSKLADVVGCRGWKVGTYAALDDAIKQALENQLTPSIIHVMIPKGSIPTNAGWKDADKGDADGRTL